jgi:hypothetical protein
MQFVSTTAHRLTFIYFYACSLKQFSAGCLFNLEYMKPTAEEAVTDGKSHFTCKIKWFTSNIKRQFSRRKTQQVQL